MHGFGTSAKLLKKCDQPPIVAPDIRANRRLGKPKLTPQIKPFSAHKQRLRYGHSACRLAFARPGIIPNQQLATRAEHAPGFVERRLREQFGFEGRHYSLAKSPALPKPVQQPRPPVIIGGIGARKTPALAARFADEFNIPNPIIPLSTTTHQGNNPLGTLLADSSTSSTLNTRGVKRKSAPDLFSASRFEPGAAKRPALDFGEHRPAEFERRVLPPSHAFAPTIQMALPARKVFPIQIGDKLFRLSGASISSDGKLKWMFEFS